MKYSIHSVDYKDAVEKDIFAEQMVMGDLHRVYIAYNRNKSLFSIHVGKIVELKARCTPDNYVVEQVVLEDVVRHHCEGDPSNFDKVTLDLEGLPYGHRVVRGGYFKK